MPLKCHDFWFYTGQILLKMSWNRLVSKFTKATFNRNIIHIKVYLGGWVNGIINLSRVGINNMRIHKNRAIMDWEIFTPILNL